MALGERPHPLRRAMWALFMLVLAAGALPGCAAGDHWLSDRALDATDIIDVKYGWALGVGVKAEATLFLGAGLGMASLGPDMHEFYGRERTDTQVGWSYPGEGFFFHLLLVGFDGYSAHGGGPPTTDSWDMVCVSLNAVLDSGPPRGIDRFRFGVEVIPVFADLGLYLNVGEVVDFIGGFMGCDPARDDGKPKGPVPVVTTSLTIVENQTEAGPTSTSTINFTTSSDVMVIETSYYNSSTYKSAGGGRHDFPNVHSGSFTDQLPGTKKGDKVQVKIVHFMSNGGLATNTENVTVT